MKSDRSSGRSLLEECGTLRRSSTCFRRKVISLQLTHRLHHVLTHTPPPTPQLYNTPTPPPHFHIPHSTFTPLSHTLILSLSNFTLSCLHYTYIITSTTMGGCISSGYDNLTYHQKPCATVISVAGELRRYPLPVTVSQVIQFETSSPDSVFLCNSDCLYFDDYVPRLDAAEALEPDQIYFVMPTSRLQSRLAASDMAALAVKASAAFNNFNPRRSRKSRISPVLVAEEDPQSIRQIKINSNSYVQVKNGRKSSLGGVPRSSSVRKMHMRRAKLAVRSFRLRLSTINEGSVLLN